MPAPSASVPIGSQLAPTRSANAESCGSRSWTDRIASVCTSSPASTSVSWSSRRFSSSSTTTRSGASSTIVATSGFLVPPTARMSGCSQNRVHATGVIPHASNVSVADGTRLTTRIGADPTTAQGPRPGGTACSTTARSAGTASSRSTASPDRRATFEESSEADRQATGDRRISVVHRLEVEVGLGRVPGVAAPGHGLPFGHGVADGHEDRAPLEVRQQDEPVATG